MHQVLNLKSTCFAILHMLAGVDLYCTIASRSTVLITKYKQSMKQSMKQSANYVTQLKLKQ